MWDVKLHPQVDKFLRKLDDPLERQLRNKLRKLKEDPFHYLEHYEGQDYYKFRMGEYRALVDVVFEGKLIKIQVLGHRSKIYKR